MRKYSLNLILVLFLILNFLSYADDIWDVLKDVQYRLINLPREYEQAKAEANELIIKLKEVEKLIDSEKTYDVYYYLGLCYFIIDKNEDAILMFDKEIELNPLHVDTYYFRAQVYLSKIEDEFEENKKLTDEQQRQKIEILTKIINDLQKLLKLAPEYIGIIIANMRVCDTSEVLLDLAEAYKLIGNNDKAKEILEKIINEYKDGMAYDKAKEELEKL